MMNFEVIGLKFEVSKIRDLKKFLRRCYNKSPSKHTPNTPSPWLLPPTIGTSHHCPPPFCHAEMTIKGTEMGYRSFLLAKLGHRQPPQQANTDTMRQQRVVPLHS